MKNLPNFQELINLETLAKENGNIITKVFQDNVKIIDDVRILYTNKATQYPDSN